MSNKIDLDTNFDDSDPENDEIQMEEQTLEKAEPRQRGGGTIKKTEFDEDDIFDVNPCKATCHQCMVEITTFVQHEMNPFFPLVVIFVFLVFGYLSFVILPITYLLTQNAVHRCSRCLMTLGIKRCFGVPDDLSQPIWHFKLGKCAIVMGKLYAVVILVMFSIFSGYYVYTKPYPKHTSIFDHPETESHSLNRTWVDFLDSCSGEKIIENQVHAAHLFSQVYADNIVEWDGYYIDTKFKRREQSMFGNNNYMSILIKMDPSESDNFADIVLSIGQEGYNNNKQAIDKMVKGDHLKFRSKIKTMGNEFKLHHLHLMDGTPEKKTFEDTGHTKDLDHIEIQESKLP